MAAIRERVKADGTRTYHVQVRVAGFPARTATFRSRSAAKKWATTIEAQMIEGKHFRSVEARRRSLGDAIDRYISDEIPKKRDADKPKARLAWWKAELGGVKLANVTPALIVERRDKLARSSYQRAKPASKRSTVKAGDAPRTFKRSPATVNRYLANLGHVFTVARKEWHWMSHNPMDGVSKLGESRGRVRSLSDDERAALLDQTANDPILHTFVMLALSTVCRAGELVKLEWRDVDLKEGRLLFRQTKNAQPRSAWLHGAALELLKAHGKVRKIDGGRVFESERGKRYRYDKAFNAAAVAAGMKDFRFHDLRHSAATYLAQAGATEQQLRAIGGWKSNVVNRYVHLAAVDAKAALEQLAAKIDRKPESE
jgi:integrase